MSFEELRAFLVVVDQGSFLSAAVALGVSRTTLRRQVDALEASAGVPLLHRNRKGVVLTDAGHKLVRSGRVMEQEFSALLHSIRETGRRPSGVVRMLLPVGLPTQVLAAVHGLLHGSWPEVHVRMRLREAPLASNLSDVDVVVWFGDGAPAGSWNSHTVLTMRQRLLADSGYLAARGTPRTLEDLAAHDLLVWTPPGDPAPCLYTLAGAALPISPALSSPDIHLIHECARLGQGIAWAPDGRLPAMPGRPALIPVLEEIVGCEVALRLAVPHALAEVPKVRVFIENLAAMRELVFGAPDEPAPTGKNGA